MRPTGDSRDATPDLRLPGGRVLPASRLRVRALTSGGPGGQHANRTATRIVVSVHVEDLPLAAHELQLVRERLANRISDAGMLAVAASDQRSQLRNRAIAVGRLERLLADALAVDPKRTPTRPSRAARERRLQHKARRGIAKRLRRRPPPDG